MWTRKREALKGVQALSEWADASLTHARRPCGPRGVKRGSKELMVYPHTDVVRAGMAPVWTRKGSREAPKGVQALSE